ncbi:MAG: hypothetical protein JSS40_18200 [Proteobacteria bacterium]|nr:hypothetical protein [Pseudomonadota bacterium]
MTDLTRTPTSARNLASLAAEILNQLLALATSVKHLHGVPGCDSDVKHLADLAQMHALEWAEYFEEEVQLHDAIDHNDGGEA